MKIFLSHQSRDKSLVKDVKELLPRFLTTWLDEEDLSWGTTLLTELETAVQAEVDFLILFVSKESLASTWVQQELQWAIQRESELNRPFVLPILFPGIEPKELPGELPKKLFLRLGGYDTAAIEALAKLATERLFQLVTEGYDCLKSEIARSDEDSPGLQDVLQGFPDRNKYFEEIVDQIRQAKRQILLCVHTLKAAEPGSQIETLHQALAEKARDLEIRILAPAGEDRARASYQLAQLGISVRHLNSLQQIDVSFSIFDSTRAVIPTESGSAEETVAGITVKSTKLAELLRESFDDLWWRSDALDYPTYIRFIVNRILAGTSTLPLQAVADRLKMPPDELSTLLPAFRMRAKPRYFFVIGRPCSGKSTVARKLIDKFVQEGIQRNRIYHFNDYQALYERFVGDLSGRVFKQAERGGFAVRDFSVLDIVLDKANCELAAGEGFFQVFIVEFARDKYVKALLNFDQKILAQSKVIHVKATHETCMQRNRNRSDVTDDRQFGYVPESIMNEFYANESLDGIHDALGVTIEEIDTDSVDLEKLDPLLTDLVRR